MIDAGEATREFYRKQGEDRERRRIIELLEEQELYSSALNPNAKYDYLVWCGIREQLIALIKDEQNG